MLESWTVRNFKSIRRQTEVGLSALTVLAGANSSGKSTLLQSMLLTAQTLGNPVDSRPVVLNGRILRLGGMDDLINRGSDDSSITIGFKYRMKRPSFWPQQTHTTLTDLVPITGLERISYEAFSCHYTFAANSSAATIEQRSLQPVVLNCTLTVDNVEGDQTALAISLSEMAPEIRAEALHIPIESLTREEREALRYMCENAEDVAIFANAGELYMSDSEAVNSPVGVRLAHFLPKALLFRYDRVSAQSESIIRMLLGRARSARFSEILLPQALVDIVQAAVDQVREDLPRTRTVQLESTKTKLSLEPTLANAVEVVQSGGELLRQQLSIKRVEMLEAARDNRQPLYGVNAVPVDLSSSIRFQLYENLRYLGPLRDEPKQFYPLEGAADPTDVGLKGEFTAAVLVSHRDAQVRYIAPDDWMTKRTKAGLTPTTLHAAVLAWLKHLDVVSDLQASDRGVHGHDLRVSIEKRGAFNSLVHVGVGVSQVLPILVMALIARPGSILIFEQPELHLHPRVQTRLADFLLSIAVGGKQCIVETHSEYMINRLRLRAAEDLTDTVSRVFSMYHVSKRDGTTHYDRVAINEYGAVPEWPEGFFDQSPREAEDILRAAMQKREQRRRGPR